MNRRANHTVYLICALVLSLAIPFYSFYWIYPHFSEIITFEKEVDAKQIATHISKMLVMNGSSSALSKENITPEFIAVLHEAFMDFDLTKVKIFSPTGEVLYSSDPKDIGVVNTNPYFTEIVARGKPFSKIVKSNERTLEDKIVTKDVVETYVPLMSNSKFTGAFEIYYDITYAEHSISTFVLNSKLILVSITLLLVFLLFLLYISALSSYRQLRKAEQRIHKIKEQLPSLYTFPDDEQS